jgi:hypothetical protein
LWSAGRNRKPRHKEDAMPLPTFLALIFGVILAAGASIAVVQVAGLSLAWLGLFALCLALFVRTLRWH